MEAHVLRRERVAILRRNDVVIARRAGGERVEACVVCGRGCRLAIVVQRHERTG